MNPQLINPTNNTIATPMENVTAEQYNEAFKKGFTPLRPDVSRSPTVTTDMFNSSPLTLPDMRTNRTFNTPTVGIPMGVTTDASGYAVYTPPQTSANDKILGSLEKIGVDLAQKPEVTRRLQEEQQLAQKTQQATIDYNNYQAAKLALQQQVEDVYKQGKTVEGADAAVRELTRVGNANLANLAVIAQASQGLLSAAEKTIKDKIDAQFSPLMEQADYWAKVASVRNNDLTEKERFRLTEISNQKKTEVASLQDIVQTIQKALLENNAPVSAFDAVDRLVTQYQSGQITATEAQTRLYQAASSAGLGTSAPGLTMTPEDMRTLVGAGFNPQEINSLKNDVKDFGVDEVLAAQTDPRKKKAIETIFNVKTLLTRAQIEAATSQKQAYDELKKTYTDEELKKVAIDNGFANFWKSRNAEVEDFLNSDKAKTLYVELLYQQYKDAGMAE